MAPRAGQAGTPSSDGRRPDPVPPLAARRESPPAAGKFVRDASGAVALGFDKHRGRPLAEVARDKADYLRWVLANVHLLDDARDLIHKALAGRLLSVRSEPDGGK